MEIVWQIFENFYNRTRDAFVSLEFFTASRSPVLRKNKLAWLSQKLFPFYIIGIQLITPLKPCTTLPWCWRDFREALDCDPILPRDSSLSYDCTLDRCSNLGSAELFFIRVNFCITKYFMVERQTYVFGGIVSRIFPLLAISCTEALLLEWRRLQKKSNICILVCNLG